MNSLESGWVTV